MYYDSTIILWLVWYVPLRWGILGLMGVGWGGGGGGRVKEICDGSSVDRSGWGLSDCFRFNPLVAGCVNQEDRCCDKLR